MNPPTWRAFFDGLTDEALLGYVTNGLNEAAHAQACEALRSRGLEPPLPPPEPAAAAAHDEDEAALGDWVLLARDLSPSEAHVLAGCLQAAGIVAEVGDTHTVTMNWLWSPALGGAKVRVREAQRDPAREVLAAMRRGEFALGDDFDVGDRMP